MNSLFEEDDREESKSDADLTLGIGSLLSIFFGVVLICGIFFGFGYSMGRRNARATVVPPTTAPEQAATTAPPLPENALSGAPLKPQSPDDASALPSDHSKSPAPPAAAKQSTPNEGIAKPPTPSKSTRVVEPSTPDPSLSAVPYAHRAPLPTKPHAGISAPLAQAPGDSPIVPGHPIVVQIAAVSRQEDAQVLADALRKRGFSPSVHPGTSDKFFHVQVGPFTDKTQADTMKQHLLADGYNAIEK
jgi:cell division septation protein DedD